MATATATKPATKPAEVRSAGTVKVVRADGATVKRQPPPVEDSSSSGEPAEPAPGDAAPPRRPTKKAPAKKRAPVKKAPVKVPAPVAPASTPRRGGTGYYGRVRRAG